MNMEINRLAGHFSATLFQVKGVYRYCIEPGRQAKMLSAPYAGFIFPITGVSQMSFADTPYLVSTGVVLHGCASVEMDCRVVGDEPWEYIYVLYDVFSEPRGIELKRAHFELRIEQRAKLYEMVFQAHSAFSRPGAIPAFQAETLFRCALSELFLSVQNEAKPGTETLFETVSSYIHTHYMEAPAISELAEINGIDENRLFYVFKKHSGMSPGDYLRNYRLNRARELLMTTRLPVSEIADKVGYADALYFSRVFKRKFGAAPSKYSAKGQPGESAFQE